MHLKQDPVGLDREFVEWFRKEKYEYNQPPDDKQFIMAGKCCGCLHYASVNARVDGEVGVCFNEDAEFFGKVRDKIDGCDKHTAYCDIEKFGRWDQQKLDK